MVSRRANLQRGDCPKVGGSRDGCRGRYRFALCGTVLSIVGVPHAGVRNWGERRPTDVCLHPPATGDALAQIGFVVAT